MTDSLFYQSALMTVGGRRSVWYFYAMAWWSDCQTKRKRVRPKTALCWDL